jgi:GT2 family glycosyltransferase
VPLISVITPTYNRRGALLRMLDGLEAQTFPHDEIEVVVVADGCTDGTQQAVRDRRTGLAIRLLEQSNRGPAAARNLAMHSAYGRIVVFIDDDVVPCPTLLSEHMHTHGEADDVAVIGPLATPKDARLSPWVDYEQAALQTLYDAMTEGAWAPSARQFFTGNASVARAAVISCGGFDETLRRGEDVELGYRLASRAGVRFAFNPRAIGYHYAERSMAAWLATPYSYGRADADLTRREAWLLPAIVSERGERHGLTRARVALCLDRPRSRRTVEKGLQQLGSLAFAAGFRGVSRAAYGALFNLLYYQGLSDGVGGRALLSGVGRDLESSHGPRGV